MSILPEGEELRKAVKWISEMRQDAPERKLADLINEAGLRFNLSPNDEACLARHLKDGDAESVC